MAKSKIFKYAFLNGVATAVYIVLVALFLTFISGFFPEEDTVIAPIFMLMLFVVSAGITGSLVLGRPILWYIDGKKKESVILLSETLGIILLIAVLVLLFYSIFGL